MTSTGRHVQGRITDDEGASWGNIVTGHASHALERDRDEMCPVCRLVSKSPSREALIESSVTELRPGDAFQVAGQEAENLTRCSEILKKLCYAGQDDRGQSVYVVREVLLHGCESLWKALLDARLAPTC